MYELAAIVWTVSALRAIAAVAHWLNTRTSRED